MSPVSVVQTPQAPLPSNPIVEGFRSILYELRWIVTDTALLTWRNLMHYRRSPEMLLSGFFGPIMFLLTFNYVFGGAIAQTADVRYIDYLVPGILIQNGVFNVMQAGIGIADDMQKGFIDRYRSLPMARSAVLGGRIAATSLMGLVIVYWTLGFAVLIGMRFHGGFWPAFTLPFVVAAFSFGFAWISVLVGVSVRSAEAASAATFIFVLPLTFLSSSFVPVETMPGWLQGFAKINPISNVVDLCRALAQGGEIVSVATSTGLWIVGFVIVIGSLATWRYMRV